MINLFRADALEIMKTIPDESLDAIITDPPYLINYSTNHRKDKTHEFNFPILNDQEDNKDLIRQFIECSANKLKNNTAIYIFCSQVTVDFFKQEIEKYFKIKNIIIWVKNNWTAGDLKAQYGKRYEMIIYANKGRRLINGERIQDVWFFDRVVGSKQIHRNQKPLDLMKQIVVKSTNENDIILDPFMGSGTTGLAAKQLNRNFIGVELDERYFNVAKERIYNGNE